MLARNDIVLAPFPVSDGPSAKPRPALVVAINRRYRDVLLAFISSRTLGPAADREERVRRRIGTLPHGLRVAFRLLIQRVLLAWDDRWIAFINGEVFWHIAAEEQSICRRHGGHRDHQVRLRHRACD